MWWLEYKGSANDFDYYNGYYSLNITGIDNIKEAKNAAIIAWDIVKTKEKFCHTPQLSWKEDL